jgi:malate dehydrogenase (oxaloacetate-decarboxylating)
MANIDAIPLCINTTDPDEIVKFCKHIEPSFGGINLEDISAPRCFDILKRLEKELKIAVFHDDQDGTAIVTLAAVINACKLTGKKFSDLKVVVNGAGAAGMAITKLLLTQKFKDIILLDSISTIYEGRKNLNPYKEKIAKKTNKSKVKGRLEEALVGSDIFIGVSKPDLVDERMIKTMNENPIIFAMANPNPEIAPDRAYKAGASIVGTGRSDYPNQINNALVFPGLFRGLLDGWKKRVTINMKIAAAKAIAESVKPTKKKILPSILDKKVVNKIARAIKNN